MKKLFLATVSLMNVAFTNSQIDPALYGNYGVEKNTRLEQQ